MWVRYAEHAIVYAKHAERKQSPSRGEQPGEANATDATEVVEEKGGARLTALREIRALLFGRVGHKTSELIHPRPCLLLRIPIQQPNFNSSAF